MSIDLTKIIAKKNYLVPVKATDLCSKVLEQLRVGYYWEVEAQRPKSAVFRMDWKEQYVAIKTLRKGKKETKEIEEAARKEYEEDNLRCAGVVQEATVENTPVIVSYIITEDRADGCTIEATCKPALYIKIVREIKYAQVDLQDVRIRGEEFLDQIFIGGLGGKEIREVVEVSRWELLINDTHTRQITERIYEMLNKATTCVLFFGWFGTECIPRLKELKEAGLTVKAITHKPAERKAPAPEEIQKGYAELIKLLGLDNVSVNPLVHGRAVIVDNKALVGSMDLNAFSLSGQHIEFAIYTEDPSTVRSLRAYFEKLFKPLKESSS
jgi:hypothetical protein